ncbi:dnaJ homolog subfamily C member 25 homolog [Phlebotomus argentipes]|uniref:dnaJ homolog subfamily C member 25 homolog n=1 Tax=Phlebotomus argentipes TaxID=94469 RepID=UPI002892D67C|nr:dnaJ homolog subfamily C member 25 homolog [Phlebotomus argentipes]
MLLWRWIFPFCCVLVAAEARLLEGLYCGRENCYDVLNITREATKQEISKSYRQLAKKYHPDLHRGEAAKKEAEEQFKAIATAYEILRDDGSRGDYDYMLDNPQEYYAHYYRYYRRRVAPKVDVRLVLFVTISVISLIQYFSWWQRYESAIKYFMTVPKYRHKALEIAQQQETARMSKKTGKQRLSKTEQKEETDKLVRKIIEENMDIQGAYAKPSIWDVLWVQLIISPYTITKWVAWNVRWFWKFILLRQPYGEEEKYFIIRKYMKMGQHKFNAIEESTKREYLELELWKKENFNQWKFEQEEAMKKELAQKASYRSIRRYMKSHGPGRITFED